MPKLPIGDITPCEIVWDYAGVALNLGPFLGSVSLKRDDSVSKVFEERMGDAAVDGVFAGSVMELTLPLTRSTWVQLAGLLPGTALSLPNELLLSNKCGSDMYVNAKQLCIKPIKDGVVSATESEWTLLFKVHPYNSWEIGWARDGQKLFGTKFLVFPDMSSAHLGEFGTLGVNP